MASPPISFGIVGVTSAEAAQFYTRKRIKGVWVEGRFPKAGRSFRSAPVRKVARTKPIRRVTEVPATATLTALPPVNLRKETVSVPVPVQTPAPSITGTLRETKAAGALPDVEAALVIAAVGPVPPADESGIVAEERLARLRRALEARADELKAKFEPSSIAAPAAASLSAPEQAGSVPVEVAKPSDLEKAGRAMSTGSVTETPSAASAGPGGQKKPAPLVPRAVSYDFETGIKTTVYESSVVREPFDRAAMRGLAAIR